MNYAVFFRNLNLGRPHCPSRAQFEAAFLDAGASAAASFLVNGTLAFQARGHRHAEAILRRATQDLTLVCGLREPGFLRRMDALAALVASDPFRAVDRSTVYDCCISFLHADARLPAPLPGGTARGDVTLLHATASEAFCIARQLGKSPGSPNAFLERILGLPATTRAWNTVLRLVAKHGS